MLFLLWLFMMCFSQVGFASEVCLLDSESVNGVDKEMPHSFGRCASSGDAKGYSMPLEEQKFKQSKCQKNMTRGFIATTAALGVGSVVSILGYCIWQEPKIVIAPLLGLAITGAVAFVNLACA